MCVGASSTDLQLCVCVCVCVCVETSEPQARVMQGTDYKVRVGQPDVTVVTKAVRPLGTVLGLRWAKLDPTTCDSDLTDVVLESTDWREEVRAGSRATAQGGDLLEEAG